MTHTRTLFAAALLGASCLTAHAGGYVTNTNQNAAFGRNLSQEASIDIISTYANPAGVAFLNPGWHLALNNQSAFQTRTATSWFVDDQRGPFLTGKVNGEQNTSATKTYKGKAKAPLIPSLDLAYVQPRWSVALHFGVVGGGGKCEFEDGLGSFESKVALLPTVMNTLAGTNAVAGYTLDTYMRGRQYYIGGQVNGTYKVTDNISLAVGLRGVYATCNYYGYVNNINAVMADGQVLPLASAPGEPNAVQTVLAPAIAPLASAVPEVMSMATQLAGSLGGVAQGVNLNCDQTGFGLTPILGVDWRINDQWNVAAKYEFKTRLRLKNESGENAGASALAQLDEYADGKKIEADIPAILTLGVQYSPIKTLRINAGGHVFFDKQATQYNHRERELDGQTWEITAGAEYDVCKWATVSAGWQTTHYGLGENSRYITDMSFVTNSNSIGLGARFHVGKRVAIDVSYFKTLYHHYEKHQTDYNNIKSNFANVLGGLQQEVGSGLTQLGTQLATQDVVNGVDPTADPRIAALSQFGEGLSTRMQSLTTAQTPGHDRLTRTNDVIGIGLILDF